MCLLAFFVEQHRPVLSWHFFNSVPKLLIWWIIWLMWCAQWTSTFSLTFLTTRWQNNNLNHALAFFIAFKKKRMESCFGVKGLRETMILHCLAKSRSHTHTHILKHKHTQPHSLPHSINLAATRAASRSQTFGYMCTFTCVHLSSRNLFLSRDIFFFFL